MPSHQTGQSGAYLHGPLHTKHRDRAPAALTGQLMWQIVASAVDSIVARPPFFIVGPDLGPKSPEFRPRVNQYMPGVGHNVLARNLGWYMI